MISTTLAVLLILLPLSFTWIFPYAHSYHRLSSRMWMNSDHIVRAKTKLYEIAAKTSRGQLATDEQKDKMMDIIAELEAENPSIDNPLPVYGVWDLIYTDSELILNSPFFLSIRELFGKETDKAMNAIRLHRSSTRTGEIGSVRQVISPNVLESQVELIVGIAPGIPFAARGSVISKAIMKEIDQFTMCVTIQDVSIKNNNILPILDKLKLPVHKIFESMGNKAVTSTLLTYYLDDELRITRDRDDHVYVYLKSTD